MSLRFMDTNVLLRYLTRDDEEKAERALALLTRLERGEERVVTSPMVVFETVFTLQTFYKTARPRIQALVAPIIQLRGLQLPGKAVYLRALDLYVQHNISFADAYNVAEMEAHGIVDVYTWDAGYARVPGISRIEPATDGEVDAGS